MQFFTLAAATAALAATASAVSISPRQDGYVPPANLFTFSNDAQIEVAKRFATNCYAQGDGFPRNMQVETSFRQNQTAEAPQLIQLTCIQGRNHGGSWDYTNQVAKTSGLELVYKSDGKCNELSFGLCSRVDYPTEVAEVKA